MYKLRNLLIVLKILFVFSSDNNRNNDTNKNKGARIKSSRRNISSSRPRERDDRTQHSSVAVAEHLLPSLTTSPLRLPDETVDQNPEDFLYCSSSTSTIEDQGVGGFTPPVRANYATFSLDFSSDMRYNKKDNLFKKPTGRAVKSQGQRKNDLDKADLFPNLDRQINLGCDEGLHACSSLSSPQNTYPMCSNAPEDPFNLSKIRKLKGVSSSPNLYNENSCYLKTEHTPYFTEEINEANVNSNKDYEEEKTVRITPQSLIDYKAIGTSSTNKGYLGAGTSSSTPEVYPYSNPKPSSSSSRKSKPPKEKIEEIFITPEQYHEMLKRPSYKAVYVFDHKGLDKHKPNRKK
ncbi:hypothetical protein SLOPH_647 [Spraguea lophii 42_110]|uniref:Uncharacterized protein n=1 Tax=Spraguea lophii (strain 42_110) TaxID=1358809 RepID=S7XL22_SPRLO|nr:hypothetical protein SLOPH_647 [Spraguea lophii 42_110]